MPWACAFCSTALPDPESRLTIMRTLTPLVIMPSAIVWNVCLSPWAFWMSYSTPAALKASSRYFASAVSHRAEDLVSGRMTPTFAAEAGASLLLDVSLSLGVSLLPHPASRSPEAITAADAMIMLRRIVLPLVTSPRCARLHPALTGARTMLRATTYDDGSADHKVSSAIGGQTVILSLFRN